MVFFNTHFDHVGSTARAESAKLLARRINELAPTGPVIVTGDLNTIAAHPALDPLLDQLSATRTKAPRSDLTGSFNNWMSSYGLVNIDFVLTRDTTVARFQTINDRYGIEFVSDHFPIVATLHLDP
jgi:endonuclease/exonuclease/phosphatase family metal-dependent hydrolase